MITIRALRNDDNLSDLIELSREFFGEYEAYHEDFFEIETLRDSDIGNFFSRALASKDAATFIALEGGRMIGYVTVSVRTRESFWRIGKEGSVSGLMVHKRHRRRGIGTRLWRKAMAFFERKGARYFTVYTSVNNAGAIKFYERAGMRPLYCHMIGRICQDSRGD
jgi:ribosomal protein S18 acetylase RimI-like enzyme